MTQEEFDTLAAARNALIVESSASGDNHLNIYAPILAPELIVNSIMNDIDKASANMSRNGNGAMGDEGGVNSSNSCYNCIFMVSCKIFGKLFSTGKPTNTLWGG